MKNVILISLFDGIGESSSRLNNIVNSFSDHYIVIITTDFNHNAKNRKSTLAQPSYLNCSIKYIHVPKYKRNLSLKRIWSHLVFSVKLHKVLRNLDYKPDLVYCAMPTSSAAYISGKYCTKKHIPFVIDVIDLWPDSLIPIIPLKDIIKFIVIPWKVITYKAYKFADYISGESKEYTEVAHHVNPKVPYSYTYLGVNKSYINNLIQKSEVILNKPDNEIWITYGGSLGQSYDFNSILEATYYIHKKGITYRLWFVGDGEKREYIEEVIKRLGINASVTGRLDYRDFLKYLSMSDIAFNSFNPQTLVVHSYKFNDYVATGCFVMNSLKGETAELIDTYNIGLNYTPDTVKDQLYKVCKNWSVISSGLQERIDTVIDKYLEKDKIYSRLADDITKHLLA